MRELRAERQQLLEEKLIHGDLSFPTSMTFVSALVLLLIGFIAIIAIVWRSGPFS
jgi:putative membrane protein